MFALRMLVTCAVLIPLWLIVQPTETVTIFIIAMIGFGSGHIVEAIVKAQRQKQPPPPS